MELGESLERLYLISRYNYYKRIAASIGTRGEALSATECFCLEIILLMDRPTISEFAAFLNSSLPNANYRLNSLVEKGYLEKEVSEQDRRESILIVTEKYRNFYGLNNRDNQTLVQCIHEHFTPEEVAQFHNMIDRVAGYASQLRKTGESHDPNHH